MDEQTRRGENRFPLEPGDPLEIAVDNPNGRVVVRTVERDDILLRWAKHGTPGMPAYQAAELVSMHDGGRLIVRVVLAADGGKRYDSGPLAGFNPFSKTVRAEIKAVRAELGELLGEARTALAGAAGHGVWYDIEIEVPRSAAVASTAVDTASGDVRVERIAGPVRVNTASGDVGLEAIDGPVRVHTASGEVEMRELRGEVAVDAASGDLSLRDIAGSVRLRTASGAVSIEEASIPSFQFQTASGDVRVRGLLTGPGPFRVETVSGGVDLDLALPAAGDREPNLSLVFRTVSGDADVGPIFRAAGRRAWRIGNDSAAGPEIAVRTVSGDLEARLELRPEAPVMEDAARPGAGVAALDPIPAVPEPPAPPMPPAPPEPAATAASAEAAPPPVDATADTAPLPVDRLSLLKAVERGEIDVEEALRRLDEAGAGRE